MVTRTLKLKPNAAQVAVFEEWHRIGAAVWNWGLARLKRTEREGWKYRARYETLRAEAHGHAKRIGVNAQSFDAILKDLCLAWDAHRSGIRSRPRWKGERNRLSSIPFRNDKRHDNLRFEASGVRLPSIGTVKCRRHRNWPSGQFACARLQRRPRGWYLIVTVIGEPNSVPTLGDNAVGIDLGYLSLATLSTGEKIEHPRELARLSNRIAQANRSGNLRLLGRVQQRLTLARRKRNHAVSRDLVSRFGAIYVSKDNLRAFQRGGFGKSVLSAAHGALRTMLEAKCRQAGRVYVEVPNRNSTRMCSGCGALTGPTGLRKLSVRVWTCACGAHHDRDVNAAVNTLRLGAALAHEGAGDRASEISH